MKHTSQNGLLQALTNYSGSGSYPFHMPGHKRNTQLLGTSLPYNIDVTEIHGFDDLHNPSGILKAAAEKAERLYHSEHSYILVNGSTCGILAAVTSAAHRGDSVIIARNCHRSVYFVCGLLELDVGFIYPETDKNSIFQSITPSQIKKALAENPGAKAVVITSPTYEGVISDIAGIAAVCHDFNVPLIVDNAHGAHLPFCSFGRSGEPVSSGADITVTSIHKTLPALTQTSVVHINGSLADYRRFEKFLDVYETSSPSYVLMASADSCLDFIENSCDEFEKYEKRLGKFYEEMRWLNHLRLLCHGGDSPQQHGFFSYDIGKLVILTSGAGITGVELMTILREKYKLELEMAYPQYALAMTSVCDTDEGFKRLSEALSEIDSRIGGKKASVMLPPPPKPMKVRITRAELDSLPDIELTEELAASGRYISRSYIYAYPPGIPIVIPGEIIGSQEYEYIELLKKSGVKIDKV